MNQLTISIIMGCVLIIGFLLLSILKRLDILIKTIKDTSLRNWHELEEIAMNTDKIADLKEKSNKAYHIK